MADDKDDSVQAPRDERGGVKRGRVGRRLDPEFDAIIRGEKPKRKPRSPRLKDPRTHSLVRGVANRDVRVVGEYHHERMLESLKDTTEERALLALLLGMETWRGLSFISPKAYLQDGLSLDENHWAFTVKARREFEESTVALWYRAESARIRRQGEGNIDIYADPKFGNQLVLRLNIKTAAQVLEEAGRAMSPLVRDNEPIQKPR